MCCSPCSTCEMDRCRTGTIGSSRSTMGMYDAYFEERGLIPEGRLCDVGYEELERDPAGVVGSIYECSACRGSRNFGPGWRATSPRSLAIARTGYEELPEPLPSHRP